MLFGYHWDTGHGELAFAISILPMLLVGLLVTIEATIVGFFIAHGARPGSGRAEHRAGARSSPGPRAS